MKQNVINIKVFKKCDITLQKLITHPLSYSVTKMKRPPPPCLTYYLNSPKILTFIPQLILESTQPTHSSNLIKREVQTTALTPALHLLIAIPVHHILNQSFCEALLQLTLLLHWFLIPQIIVAKFCIVIEDVFFLTGLAGEGMCKFLQTQSVSKDKGLMSALTMAHEIAHK